MTAFNTIAKIGRRVVSELENLKIFVLEQSLREENVDVKLQLKDKGRYNTVSKLRRRKIGEIQGLKMSVVQVSFREFNSITKIKNTCVDTTNYNTLDKVGRREYSELNGLLVSIIENSYRTIQTTFKGIKVVKPIKTYKNKIKLLFKYNNKIKH